MNNYKKNFLIFFMLCFTVYSFAVDFDLAVNTSNFSLTKNSDFKKIPGFGGRLVISDQITSQLSGKIAIERDADMGNIIWSRIIYNTQTLSISAGPSLGVFNSPNDKNDMLTLFQPGLGIGMTFTSRHGFSATVDTAFSLTNVNITQSSVFLQSSVLSAGWKFPNLLASLKISQRNKTLTSENQTSYFSITDYGLYTEAFSKPSKIRVPVNVFFRQLRYDIKDNAELKKVFGLIVIESGFTHVVSNEIEWFFNVGASVYSFAVTKEKAPLNKFFFNSEIGVKFSI